MFVFQLFIPQPRKAKFCPRRYSSKSFLLSLWTPSPHVCMWTDAPCLDVCYFRLSWADKVWVVGRQTAWVPQSNGPACHAWFERWRCFEYSYYIPAAKKRSQLNKPYCKSSNMPFHSFNTIQIAPSLPLFPSLAEQDADKAQSSMTFDLCGGRGS
jgi:hypothetical protein